MMDNQEFQIRFTYHPPSEEQVRWLKQIRETAREFVGDVVASSVPSREQDIAITKIEEAVMWANAAIARRGCKSSCPDVRAEDSHRKGETMRETHLDPSADIVTTPDEDYPIRILNFYWLDAHSKYTHKKMNEMQDARKSILEEAMKILREPENMQRLKNAAIED